MQTFDVVIVGASFSGITLAQHLPRHLRILIVDAKPYPGSTVESTGLITTKTYEEFESFFPIKEYITNPISSIAVVAPSYTDWFISSMEEPWIYQTDTRSLVGAMAKQLPDNVEVRVKTVFMGIAEEGERAQVRIRTTGQAEEIIETRFLVGADGSHSAVAKASGLTRHTNFLFGFEQVFFGSAHMGPNPEETIYHFWFGEFSLGYGGWMSPTVVDGRSALRIGLAKLEKDRGDAKRLLQQFVARLLDENIITLEGEIADPHYTFGSLIPIGGVASRISRDNILLIGDAAGYCGAFAADGIKGSLVSGKEAAKLIEAYLENGVTITRNALHRQMDAHGGLLHYYKRQVFYRFVWDQMRRDRSFKAMFDIIKQEQEGFLHQFCDSKDKRRSLSRTVLKFKYIPELIRYAIFIGIDMIARPTRRDK